MYRILIKPLLFLLSTERVHKIVIFVMRVCGRLPILQSILRSTHRVEDPSLEREVFGLRFKNPVGVAAGFDVNAEAVGVLDALGFGFVEVGSITPESQYGNKRPRLHRLEADGALVNNMGHSNRGWAYAIDHLRRRKPGVVVGCNIAQSAISEGDQISRDYQKSFRNLYQYVDYFTLCIEYDNLNCTDKASAIKALGHLLEPLFDFRRGQSEYRPILIKVTPDLSNDLINAVSNVLITTPLDGVVAVSGTHNRTTPLQSESIYVERAGSGELTGTPLRERALEVVRMLHMKSGGAYPIIGVGGLMSAADVKAMMDAGASLVQLYTGLIYEGPSIANKICRGLIEGDEEVKIN